MKKNKLLGIAIAVVITMSSIVPAFAAETVSQDQTISGITSEEKQANKEEKLAKLTERATKFGIDISGLTNEQAREKIRGAVALKLGVEITGLSKEEAKAKIQSARAAKLGIDITGLSFEEAKAKIQDAREVRKQEITEKITERAAKFGVDTTGLTNKEAKEKIKGAREEAKATKITTLAN